MHSRTGSHLPLLAYSVDLEREKHSFSLVTVGVVGLQLDLGIGSVALLAWKKRANLFDSTDSFFLRVIVVCGLSLQLSEARCWWTWMGRVQG